MSHHTHSETPAHQAAASSEVPDLSAPTQQFANQMPSQTGSVIAPQVASPPTMASGTASETEHHHHHYHHHSGDDPSEPSSSTQPVGSGTSKASQPHRKQSRKHSHKTRPSHHSHKGPFLDPNDPSLTAPGSDGRPFSDGEAEEQPLMAQRRGPGDRPNMIQYGSVYYYPLSRQNTDSEYETQGRRMLLLAVIAIITIMGVLALNMAKPHDPHQD